MVKKFNAKIKYLIFCFSLIHFSGKAQHPYFASLNQQLLSLNPAFAGSNKELRVQAMGGSIDFSKYGYYKSGYYASADILFKKHSGIGITFYNERFGKAFQNTQVNLNYAYHFIIKEKLKIVPSFQISFFQFQIKTDNLSTQELNDIYSNNLSKTDFYVPMGTLNKFNMDFSGGLLVYKENFFAGVSILSFTQPDEGLFGVSKRPFTQIYQGAYRFKINEKSNVDAYALLKSQQNRENFLQYGTNIGLSVFTLHLANRIYETSKIKTLIAGINFDLSGFKVGYNSQMNFAPSRSVNFFNEIYLSMNFGKLKKKEDGENNNVPQEIKLFF